MHTALNEGVHQDQDYFSSGRLESNDKYKLLLAEPVPEKQPDESKIMTGATHVKAETKPATNDPNDGITTLDHKTE